MPVTERHFEKDAAFLRKTIMLAVQAVGNSETDTLFDSFKPGYRFKILAIEHYAEGVTAAADYNIKIGTVSALAAVEVPTAATREDAVLNATAANLNGSATDVINLHSTTDGSGDFTGLKVKVTIRLLGVGYGDL